jgi:uncharacterized LabA/DUF88 family protein
MLLDAGFLRYKLGTAQVPADASAISALTDQVAALPCLMDMRLHRIYFYDAKPLDAVATVPLSKQSIHFGRSSIATRNRRMHSELSRQPFFALRFGELVHGGWRLKRGTLKAAGPRIEVGAEDLEPDIRQKGVDMRIGLDIASLTLKQQVKVIVLISGDSDFIPAMKFARREGAQSFLVTLGHGIKDEMREHADLVVDGLPGRATVPTGPQTSRFTGHPQCGSVAS